MDAMNALDRTRRAQAVVTPALTDAFARDGAVCLRGLLNADEVALLRSGIDANIAAPSPRAKVASRPDDPGFFIEDFCCWQDNDAYRRVIFDSPLAAAAGLLMQSQSVRLYHDHMLTKEPGTRQKTPWHQDQPYYNIDGRQNISFWIPVDPVRRHSTLEFVAARRRRDADHASRHRGGARPLSHPRLGGGAGRRDRLPHAQPACGRRGGRRHAAAGVLGAHAG